VIWRLASLAVALVAMTLGGSARAEDEASSSSSSDTSEEPAKSEPSSPITTRVGTQIAGYTDSVGVSVLTPSVSGRVENPIAGWSAQGRYLVDMVSAASPDVVATASPRWTEVRHAGSIGGQYKPGELGVAAGAAVSYTPDYLALSANLQATEELSEKNITLIQGYSYGRDTIGRTGTPFSVFSRDLTTHALSAGISAAMTPSLVMGLYADGVFERGDQSKPYRYIPIFDPSVAPRISSGASAVTVANSRLVSRPLEQLPLARDRWAMTARAAFRTKLTTLRLEQRVYLDTWDLKATTTDFRWFVDLSERVMWWPHLRVHVQSGVDFWQRAYTAHGPADLPAVRTGDRELSPLSNFGLGSGVRLALGKKGTKDDLLLSFTADGTWTSFQDALYVKDRFSLLAGTTLELKL
jgi:hypothetical protein